MNTSKTAERAAAEQWALSLADDAADRRYDLQRERAAEFDHQIQATNQGGRSMTATETPEDTTVYAIKVRAAGERRFNFLTPKGGETHLRIHACMFTGRSRVDAAMAELTTDNTEFEFKVVPF